MDKVIATLPLIISGVSLLLLVILTMEVVKLKALVKSGNSNAGQLRLQAYERLAVFADRAGLQNLISRTDAHGQSAAFMHGALIDMIKSEFDYNASQQVYVSKELWAAVTKLKDQHIYIVNQLAAMLPAGSTSLDLSKRILEYTMSQPQDISKVVQEAVQIEAKEALNS